MHNKGEDTYQHLCVVQLIVNPREVDHEAGAMFLSIAYDVILIHRPEQLKSVVAAYHHQQQDDAVLEEYVEKGKSEA